MDQPPTTDEPETEEQQSAPEGRETPAPPEVVFEGLSTGKEPWRGSGCSSRLPLYGCVIGIAVLIGVLFAGAAMMRRTVWVNMERGRVAVVQRLPPELPLAERQRTIRNLERFRALLEAVDDPYPEMGEFMTKIRTAFADGRFTPDEVEALNLYLERTITESGVPPMQLGIQNSEFGIRMCDRLVTQTEGGWGKNSKFEIRNPKFFHS
jgi:hypothetical protein